MPLKIDFVSDVSCPWCAIGLNALEQALARVAPQIQASLHFQPFELNRRSPPRARTSSSTWGASTASTRADRRQCRGHPPAWCQRGLRVRPGQAQPHLQHLRRPPPAALGRRGGCGPAARAQACAVQGLFHRRPESGRPCRAACRPRPRRGWMPTRPPASWPAITLPPTCARPRASTTSRASARCRPSSSTTAT